MSGFKINIEKATINNTKYRRVLYTTKELQLVVMSLPKGDDINCEKHIHTTQFIRIEEGTCVVYMNKQQYRLGPGDCVVIPSGTLHYVKNTGQTDLKLYTIYSPPEHPDQLVQATHV